jgi:hypothetical protein
MYEDSGFEYHVVNFIKLEKGVYMAFDVTAHYNFFGKDTDNKIFCLIGSSIEDLHLKLKILYGLKINKSKK